MKTFKKTLDIKKIMTKLEFPHKEFKINYKGRVHFQEWYKLAFNFLQDKGYSSSATEMPGYPNFEEYLLDITLPDGKKNMWVHWRTKKKFDDMYTYIIDVEFQVQVNSLNPFTDRLRGFSIHGMLLLFVA